MDILVMLILQSMNMVHASIYLCLPWFISSVLCSFLGTGLLPPWLGLFLGTLIFLLLYQMGFFSWFLFVIFLCWYTKVRLISEHWLHIPLLCQIHILHWVAFSGVYRVFYVHYHVICKQWQFYLLLYNLDAFYIWIIGILVGIALIYRLLWVVWTLWWC